MSAAWAAAVAAVVVAAAVGVIWLPVILNPLPSAAELSRVRDPAKRIELRTNARKLQGDTRALALQGIAGIVVAAGAIAAWRQLNIGRGQLTIAQEGQITERFTRAVDQLGSASLDVRTGGIYALERIAKDSPADRAAVAEILTAFVRAHSPWPPTESARELPPLAGDPATEHARRVSLRSRAADVQAAMTVLGRRPRRPEPITGEEEYTLGLGGVDLRFADLRGLDLERAWLAQSNLAGAELEGTNLRHASLWRTDLRKALLVDADLRDADLREAKLGGAWLIRTQLARIRVRDTDFTDAITKDARYDDSES